MLPKQVLCWLADTHSTQFELVRHFCSQHPGDDLISSSGRLQRTVIAALAGLACSEPVMVRLYLPKYAYLQALTAPDLYLSAVHADRLFFISLSMIVAGLITVIQWQALFPTLQDYFVLKPLPLELSQIFIARFMSSFLMVAVAMVALNIAASRLFPWISSGRWQSPSFGMQYVLAHALVTIAAGLFVFLSLVAVHGILRNLLPHGAFHRFSLMLQVLFATTFVVAIPYAFDLPNWNRSLDRRPQWMWLFPPAWFLGLYEKLLGSNDAEFLNLAAVAIRLSIAAAVTVLATYLLSYHRHASRVLEHETGTHAGNQQFQDSALAYSTF